jgi:hypothetical protein
MANTTKFKKLRKKLHLRSKKLRLKRYKGIIKRTLKPLVPAIFVDEQQSSERTVLSSDVDGGGQVSSLEGGKIIIIAPKDYEKTRTPLFCPLCEYPMKTMEDSMSYRSLGACEHCEKRWKKSRLIKNVEKLKKHKSFHEYLLIRAISARPIFNLK